MAVVGGHPALVRIALYHLCRKQVTLEQLLRSASTNMGVYRDHLQRLLIILQENPELADALAAVVMAEHKVYLEPVLAANCIANTSGCSYWHLRGVSILTLGFE